MVCPNWMRVSKGKDSGSPKRFWPFWWRNRPGIPPEKDLGYSDHFPVAMRFRKSSEEHPNPLSPTRNAAKTAAQIKRDLEWPALG